MSGSGARSNFPTTKTPQKRIADHLPKVDPAAQAQRLKMWQDVLQKLEAIPRAELSPAEQLNYDVYRSADQGADRRSAIS